MRHVLGDPTDDQTYFSPEAWVNEISISLLASSTRKAIPIVQLDRFGNIIDSPGVIRKSGQNHLLMQDHNILDKLSEVVTQLKLANMYQAAILGTTFGEKDIET